MWTTVYVRTKPKKNLLKTLRVFPLKKCKGRVSKERVSFNIQISVKNLKDFPHKKCKGRVGKERVSFYMHFIHFLQVRKTGQSPICSLILAMSDIVINQLFVNRRSIKIILWYPHFCYSSVCFVCFFNVPVEVYSLQYELYAKCQTC